jgi:hypothetical protein
MRGRNNGGGNNNNNNNNRRGPNPLTRNYESNGPDVKIRGSAQQIAEKYTTLARDAHSSGDRVMSENYLQHAEHYNRIIAAAQAQFATQQVQTTRDDLDDDLDEGPYGFDGGMNGGEMQAPAAQTPAQQTQPQPANGSGPQPIIDGLPAEVALSNENQGQPQGGGRHRERRHQHHRNVVNSGNVAPAASAPEAPEPVQGSTELVAQAPEQPAVAAENMEPREQPPRRGRRPRRPITAEAAGAEAGQPPQGDADTGSSDSTVVVVES